MNLDRAVMIFAGCVILTSVALAHWVHPYWVFLTVFAGLNMIQAALTGFCPVVYVFRWLGLKPGCAFANRATTTTHE